MALFTVRSVRMFREQLDYNILFRWFLDMSLEEPSFDATSFTKNRVNRHKMVEVTPTWIFVGRNVQTKRAEVEPTPTHGSCLVGRDTLRRILWMACVA